MGEINTIKGDKKTKKNPNKYMVTVTFDLWSSDEEMACMKLADYLECALTGENRFGEDEFNEFKKPYARIYFEASKLYGKYGVEDGKDFLV